MTIKASYNEIQDDTYLGIITVLGYDISVRKFLCDVVACRDGIIELANSMLPEWGTITK